MGNRHFPCDAWIRIELVGKEFDFAMHGFDDKHYVAWRNDVNKQQSFIVSQLTLYCTIRMCLSNISRKEHIQYFLVFWGWIVSDSILQLIWVNVLPIFIICIWTWTCQCIVRQHTWYTILLWRWTHQNTALECCFPSCTSYVCISNQSLEHKSCPIHS